MSDDKIPPAVAKELEENPLVRQFVEEGNQLLEETNKPNIITVEQFLPFIPLFRIDKERYGRNKDSEYTASIDTLYKRYIQDLNINLHEVTYVIASLEDPTILVALDRRFTRLRDDRVEGKNYRDNIPASAMTNPHATRETLIFEASIADMLDANKTPAAQDHFLRTKMESAVVVKMFTELNLSADKRDELVTVKEGVITLSTNDDFPDVTLVDDE